jgi:hypothetical protein
LRIRAIGRSAAQPSCPRALVHGREVDVAIGLEIEVRQLGRGARAQCAPHRAVPGDERLTASGNGAYVTVHSDADEAALPATGGRVLPR